jgi:hypothetical protein
VEDALLRFDPEARCKEALEDSGNVLAMCVESRGKYEDIV